MKIDGLTHPKIKQLALKLDVPLPHAVGLLEFLWAFGGKQTPRGDIGRWPNDVIAAEAQWGGDPDEFVNALIYTALVDEDPEHRLVIHDWADHCPNWIHAKLKKAGQTIIRRNLCEGLSTHYKPSQDQPSQAKASQGQQLAPAPASSPPAESDGFDEFWTAYPRKEDKKKAKIVWRSLPKHKREAALADCKTRYKDAEKRFIPHASTYLRGERWNDEPLPQKGGPQRGTAGGNGKGHRAIAALKTARGVSS